MSSRGRVLPRCYQYFRRALTGPGYELSTLHLIFCHFSPSLLKNERTYYRILDHESSYSHCPSNPATKLFGSQKPLRNLNFVSRTSPYKGIYDWDFWKPALWKHETHSLTIPMRLIILGQLEKHNIMNFDWKHWNGQIISFILRLGFFSLCYVLI